MRRTAASLITGAGVPRLVVKKLLNHVERDITAVYDRHGYDAEKRDALERWERRLMALVRDDLSGVVVPFVAASSRLPPARLIVKLPMRSPTL